MLSSVVVEKKLNKLMCRVNWTKETLNSQVVLLKELMLSSKSWNERNSETVVVVEEIINKQVVEKYWIREKNCRRRDKELAGIRNQQF